MRTVWFDDGIVKLIDQRYLPFEVRVYEAKTYEDVAVAIEDMVVRGSPAIGATAAYGMAQAAHQGLDLKAAADRLRKTRPTGHDLFFAIDSMMKAASGGEDLVEVAERYASPPVRGSSSSPRGAGRKHGPRRHSAAQVGEDPVVFEDFLPDPFQLLPQGGPPSFELPDPIADSLSALPPLLLFVQS